MNTVNDVKISRDRKYVIVCNKSSGMWAGCMLFWGQLTRDDEKRSFGGYTTDVDKCERYTMEEIAGFSPAFAVWKPGMSYKEFRECQDVVIEPETLPQLGLKTMRVWYRP